MPANPHRPAPAWVPDRRGNCRHGNRGNHPLAHADPFRGGQLRRQMNRRKQFLPITIAVAAGWGQGTAPSAPHQNARSSGSVTRPPDPSLTWVGTKISQRHRKFGLITWTGIGANEKE